MGCGPSDRFMEIDDHRFNFFIERLDQYLYTLARYEIAWVRISGWLEGKELPNRVQSHTPGIPSKDFPCEVFRRCKDIVRGKDVIPITSATIKVSGIIRALVQQHHPFKLIGVEPAALSWWRRRLEKGRARITQDDHHDLSCYPPESEPGLDVASVHAKEVDRWLLPLALRIDEIGVSQLDEPGTSGHDESKTGETKELEPSRPKEPEVSKSEEAGIPQSDSAEKVDRQLCGLS
ncbi:hypothetical protein FFLO_03297 [Filobasidium floriforme]|uniref:Uncharacterized protein n=1 Tax=Filobasidium floriforme TaxID=5210 RepID=A0A8K0JL07_9TREE|nr:uncharacterized protein HD553DRAFT_143359 [Filobasidium floriforme]KAG7544336.1 hypothetical protein FFLO_03297 [Filobasidium floriforme]KAH8078633.1 hypothetical protein HD553DRAFT_143359 [Filobasidium floriforme]